jgi:hypothetical protein
MTGAQREELEALFRYCARVPDEMPVAGVARPGWSDWDSMAQVTLVGAIEDQFDLVLDIDEAQGVLDWESCLRLVARKLGG